MSKASRERWLENQTRPEEKRPIPTPPPPPSGVRKVIRGEFVTQIRWTCVACSEQCLRGQPCHRCGRTFWQVVDSGASGNRVLIAQVPAYDKLPDAFAIISTPSAREKKNFYLLPEEPGGQKFLKEKEIERIISWEDGSVLYPKDGGRRHSKASGGVKVLRTRCLSNFGIRRRRDMRLGADERSALFSFQEEAKRSREEGDVYRAEALEASIKFVEKQLRCRVVIQNVDGDDTTTREINAFALDGEYSYNAPDPRLLPSEAKDEALAKMDFLIEFAGMYPETPIKEVVAMLDEARQHVYSAWGRSGVAPR